MFELVFNLIEVAVDNFIAEHITFDTIIWGLSIVVVLVLLVPMFVILDATGNEKRYEDEAKIWDEERRLALSKKWDEHNEVKKEIDDLLDRDD